VLLEQGRFREAKESFARAGERTGPWQEECDLMLNLAPSPAAAAQTEQEAALARMSFRAGRFHEAAEVWSRSLAADPGRGRFLDQSARYQGARAAARAAALEELDDQERRRWQRQALDWLRAELTELEGRARADDERARIRRELERWVRDPALESVRREERLASLPASESSAAAELWLKVEELLEGV